MKGFSRLLVVAVSAVTLVLVGAVGASAGAKTLGTPKAVNSVVTLVSGHSDAPTAANTTKVSTETKSDEGKHGDKEKGQCKPPKKAHKHGTPGHKHHPCGDQDDDTD